MNNRFFSNSINGYLARNHQISSPLKYVLNNKLINMSIACKEMISNSNSIVSHHGAYISI